MQENITKPSYIVVRYGTIVSPFFDTEGEAYVWASENGFSDRCSGLFDGVTIKHTYSVDMDAIYLNPKSRCVFH